MTNRRDFLKYTSALLGFLMSSSSQIKANVGVKKVILLRSSWQTINIGDIGHTPGVLSLIENNHEQKIQFNPYFMVNCFFHKFCPTK